MDNIILHAQQAVASKDYREAVRLFGEILERNVIKNHSLPLLSRSTCYVEIGEFDKAIRDAEAVLQLPDSHSSIEFLPNCFSTHSAAYTRLAHVNEKLGNRSEMLRYQKAFTEYNKAMAQKMGDADEIRCKGNDLFKAGKFEEAVAEYSRAVAVDNSRPEIFNNLALSLTKIGRLSDALDYVNEALAINPAWEKAWYRKGSILMQLKRYGEAALVFQQGLSYAPLDADLKQAFVQASKASETAKDGTGFDTSFMGMMAELKNNSFSVNSWFSKGWATKSKLCNVRGGKGAVSWERDVAPYLNSVKLHKKLNDVMRPVFPLFNATQTVPAAFLDSKFDRALSSSPLAFILPSYPLLTVLLFHTILTFCEPLGINEWAMVFTLAISNSQKELFVRKAASLPSFPYVSSEGVVMLLLGGTEGGKSEGHALDVWSWYDALSKKIDPKPDSFSWSFETLKRNAIVIKSARDTPIAPFVQNLNTVDQQVDEYGLNKQVDLSSTFLYTCNSLAHMRELLVSYYKNRDASKLVENAAGTVESALRFEEKSSSSQSPKPKVVPEHALLPVSERSTAKITVKPTKINDVALRMGQIIIALSVCALSLWVYFYVSFN